MSVRSSHVNGRAASHVNQLLAGATNKNFIFHGSANATKVPAQMAGKTRFGSTKTFYFFDCHISTLFLFNFFFRRRRSCQKVIKKLWIEQKKKLVTSVRKSPRKVKESKSCYVSTKTPVNEIDKCAHSGNISFDFKLAQSIDDFDNRRFQIWIEMVGDQTFKRILWKHKNKLYAHSRVCSFHLP